MPATIKPIICVREDSLQNEEDNLFVFKEQIMHILISTGFQFRKKVIFRIIKSSTQKWRLEFFNLTVLCFFQVHPLFRCWNRPSFVTLAFRQDILQEDLVWIKRNLAFFGKLEAHKCVTLMPTWIRKNLPPRHPSWFL